MSKILIVEDEEHLAFGLKYNFQAEGHEVVVVGDGSSALRAYHDHEGNFDLIILDLMLPGKSGYEICAELRRINFEVPILVLSARSLAEDRTRAFDVGADQYQTKPFDLRELLSRARNLMERRGSNRASRIGADRLETYEFADAKIDFRKYEVVVGKKRKKLTPMEFSLLELFIRHEGDVLSRADLLDKVWGISPPPVTRTVDNFVMRLRKHFEKDPARPNHFLSIRGAGYRFVKEGGIQEVFDGE